MKAIDRQLFTLSHKLMNLVNAQSELTEMKYAIELGAKPEADDEEYDGKAHVGTAN